MRFELTIRARMPNERIDDMLDSVNSFMSDFGFEDKIMYNGEIATQTVTLTGITLEDYKSIPKKMQAEIKTMLKETGEKVYSKHLADVKIEVTGPFQ